MRQNPHVRICGGPGSATTLVYPTWSTVWGAGGPLPGRRQERCTADADDGYRARGRTPPSRRERVVDIIRNITVDGEAALAVDTAEELGRALLTGRYVVASDAVRAEYGLTDTDNSDTEDIVDESDWRDAKWRAEGGRPKRQPEHALSTAFVRTVGAPAGIATARACTSTSSRPAAGVGSSGSPSAVAAANSGSAASRSSRSRRPARSPSPTASSPAPGATRSPRSAVSSARRPSPPPPSRSGPRCSPAGAIRSTARTQPVRPHQAGSGPAAESGPAHAGAAPSRRGGGHRRSAGVGCSSRGEARIRVPRAHGGAIR